MTEPEAIKQDTISNDSLRVLVVDDNSDVVITLGLLLGSVGYNVRTSSDGEDALLQAAEFQPDVILLDIGLPKLNGYKVAKTLRETGFKNTLIAMTGYGQLSDRENSSESGFDHHLVKPTNFSDLQELLAGIKPNRE